MDNRVLFDEELKAQWRYAFEKARSDRERYFNWIKAEIEKAIEMINQYDKIYVLGGLGAMLVQSVPTFYNTFLEEYEGVGQDQIPEEEKIKEDDAIETLLEHAMNIATATANDKIGTIPTIEQINDIYNQLHKIKINVNFYEQSADIPSDGNEFDHWLKTNIMIDSMNVRGIGYAIHIKEIFLEMFALHDGFISQYYGFTSQQLFDTIIKLDQLVYSKIGNPQGASASYDRLQEWIKEQGDDNINERMVKTGKHFFEQFTEDNPDLTWDEGMISYMLDDVESYPKIFWVIPKKEHENKIFNVLSLSFGDNYSFFQPEKFKAFPLGQSLINVKPLIKYEEKYYHFSTSLAFRNLFKIGMDLIEKADSVYFEHKFKGNSFKDSRDNYIELKVKRIFEKLLPSASFYHSLKYKVTENGQEKATELDILGVGNDTVYIIEIKAGELSFKHRRGALKGLKDRLEETINEGSYQCHRALKYIQDKSEPEFEYAHDGTSKILKIDKSKITHYYKITVSLEHFGSISANLRYLVESGILKEDFKWAWMVSIFDLMVFSEIIENEGDFKEYLNNRISLYDREDVQFLDEIDVLGFFIDGNFPLGKEEKDKKITMINYSSDIDKYFDRKSLGYPTAEKPKRKRI